MGPKYMPFSIRFPCSKVLQHPYIRVWHMLHVLKAANKKTYRWPPVYKFAKSHDIEGTCSYGVSGKKLLAVKNIFSEATGYQYC